MTCFPKRGTPLKGKDAGYVADGAGGKIGIAQWRRERMKIAADEQDRKRKGLPERTLEEVEQYIRNHGRLL